MPEMRVSAAYQPAGDQPQAIEKLVAGLRRGERTRRCSAPPAPARPSPLANVIEQISNPTLVLAHNKTLAAQLYKEFREFFPHNAVQYFVCYYDYYQPEAYIPGLGHSTSRRTRSINEDIDRLRLAATVAPVRAPRRRHRRLGLVHLRPGLARRLQASMMVCLGWARSTDRDDAPAQAGRHPVRSATTSLSSRGTFRVRGDVIELLPAYAETAYRIELFGDEVESISHFNPLTGEVLRPAGRR